MGAIRADAGYAHLALRYGRSTRPGQGQTVGIIDTGIDRSHPIFADKTIYQETLPDAGDFGDIPSHGTAVASVIAGDPSEALTAQVQAAHGVARGADIAMFAIPLGSAGDRPYQPVSLTAGPSDYDSENARLYTRVTQWSRDGRRLDFVNASFGLPGLIEQYSARGLRAALGETLSAFAQSGRGEKTVFVFAAGNANGRRCNPDDFTTYPQLCRNGRVVASSPSLLAGLPARIPELRGHMLAVAALAPDTDEDGFYKPADFSNACGIAAEWCLAAPGEAVRVAYFGPNPETGETGLRGAYTADGTSLAAPMVTGGLVLMKHAFRDQLSNTDLAQRLLQTANNRGAYADRSLYGRGVLDLGAALTPVGRPGVALQDHVAGPQIDLAGTGLQPGPAFGTGPTRGFAAQELAIFDTLGAPFWLPLDTLVHQAAPPSTAARLLALTAPAPDGTASRALQPPVALLHPQESNWYLGQIHSATTGSGTGHLSLANRALAFGVQPTETLALRLFSTAGTQTQNPASGATLSWSAPRVPIGLRAGLLDERQSFLGSRLSGAFGTASARALFLGLDWQGRINSWTLNASAEIGRTDSDAHGGIVADFSPLISSAFALEARRALGGGQFAISLGQPLRVETGRVQIALPIGRTTDGQVLRRAVSANLAPKGRQIDIAAGWSRSFEMGSAVQLGAVWSHQPGHTASATPQVTMQASWRIAF